uniref:Outer membrane protein beta-barrel domain-containing protein n=1 Tax=Chlorobium chlorochromatii (strain CaD3) TaxID=340177 RepID=Q3ASV7_CHLCH
MKLLKQTSIAALLGMMALPSLTASAAPYSSTLYMPNSHGKSVTTPTAWGASGNVGFVGLGGTYQSPYTDDADGAAVFGVGLGDSKENLGVQIALISLDISEWEEYSSAFHVFKELGDADAIGIGVENVMLTDGGDSEKSFYVVYSRGVQNDWALNKNSNQTKFHYSIGAGTSRFGDKSPADIADGKGKHGTYVFGNVAYEIAEEFNVIADWNGVNFNIGASKSFIINNKIPVGVSVGLADLTTNSGDGVRLVAGAGFGFKL